MSISSEPVAWRRENGHDFVGALAVSDGFVRLAGRDPDSSLEVSLSIPFGEIRAVRARPRGEVVLELAGSQAIRLRGIGDRAGLAARVRSAVRPSSRAGRSRARSAPAPRER